MRRAVAVLVFLAGCSAAPELQQPLTDPFVLVDVCPTQPTGDVTCDVDALLQAERDGRPDPTVGWKCLRQWTDGAILELHMSPQGRLGVYWDWEPWKADGLPLQRLALYTDKGVGESVHVAYQPRGFHALPGTHEGAGVEIQEMLGVLRVHAKIDGGWVQDPDNVTFLVDTIGADLWWAVRFDWAGGPYFVNTMAPEDAADRLTGWTGESWRGMVAGTEVIVEPLIRGARHTNVDLSTYWLSPSLCAVPEAAAALGAA